MSLATDSSTLPQPPIAPNPYIEGLSKFRQVCLYAFYVLLVLLFLFLLLNILILGEFSWKKAFPWASLYLPFTLLLSVGYLSTLLHYWKRVEPWRLNAALGNQRLLANEQPQLDSNALPVPSVIRLYQAADYRLNLIFGILIGIFFPLYTYLALTVLAPYPFPWYWSLLIGLVVGMAFLLRAVTQARSAIEITEEGIRFRLDRKTVLLPWQEARLFACYREIGPWKRSPRTIYELSSAHLMVQWTWVHRKSLLNSVIKPSLSFEKHTAQMQALCSLVSARTGLPLYDLDKASMRKEDVNYE